MRYVIFLALFVTSFATAKPIASATSGDITVTLTDELCELTQITNLKNRATWIEKDKKYEGCWGVSPFGVVMSYWDDKSVAVIPAEAFQKVTEI